MSDKIYYKHKKFADLVLLYGNATRAYLEVYPGVTYESAMANASRLLRNDKVNTYISDRLKEHQMNADEAIKLISDIAHGDIADFMDITSLGFTLDLKKAQERGLTKLIKKVKQKTTTYIAKKESDEDREVTEIEIELYPADAAQDRILRVSGSYKDPEIPNDLNINVTIGKNDSDKNE